MKHLLFIPAIILFSNFFISKPIHAEDQNELAVNKVKGELSIMVLGSGGPVATSKGRASSGYLIFTDGEPRILMDAGGGTYTRMAESGVNLHKLDTVLLTHLHIDHTADISALLKSLLLQNVGAKTKRSASETPMHFYGPGPNKTLPQAAAFDGASDYVNGLYDKEKGLERYIHGFTKAINAGDFGYTTTEISADYFSDINDTKKPVDVKTIISTKDGLVVKAIGVHHGPVPSLAYRIEYKGKSIVYSGDTSSKTDNMITISKDADVLIYDTAIMDDLPPEGTVFRKLHTSPTRMGEIAALAKAKKLILSHITPVTEPRIKVVIDTVKNVGFTGEVTEANDLDVYNLK